MMRWCLLVIVSSPVLNKVAALSLRILWLDYLSKRRFSRENFTSTHVLHQCTYRRKEGNFLRIVVLGGISAYD